ncbi:MAG TPA: SRPBCC family protein [Terracidiphilus sp.]|nr:SRPBCC family protein [Terracidiphilus sp.]
MSEIELLATLPTRRAFVAGVAASLAALAARDGAAQEQMQEKPPNPAHASLTAIHYDIDFHASPQQIYSALLDAKQFAAFSGMAAEIDRRPGGAFSLFGGLILGRIIELVESQRIVQAWRPGSWDSGVYSIVHFELKARGSESALAFDHTGFPTGLYDHLDGGWQSHYWEPMKKYFAAA